MHEFYAELVVDASIDDVFDFFNRPENLVKLMPPFMSFKLLTPGKLTMKEGAVFDYNVTVFGVPKRWTTYISDYDPPNHFADIQLQGPNSYWHHVHSFKRLDKGTLVTDHIHYLLPLGILGRIANALVMGPIVNALFNHRTKIVGQQFGILKEIK